MPMIETNHYNAGAETNNVTNTASDESGEMNASAATSTSSTTSVRKRTRATAEQLSVLEDTFADNVSPNSKLRKELSERLQMSERSIQIWFQNRRAKVKHVQKRAQMQMQQASIRAQLYHYHQQQYGMQPYGGAPIMPLPQHQHHQQQQMYPSRIPLPRSSSMDHSLPTPPASTSSSSCTSSASPSASLDPSIPPTHHLSYPSRDTMEFPDYLHGGPLSPSLSPHHDYSSSIVTLSHPPVAQSPIADANASSTPTSSSSSMPALIAVPDAGPTAMLATSATSASSLSSSTTDNLVSTPATSPSCMADQTTVRPQDIWPASVHQNEHMMRSQSLSISSSLHTGNKTCADLTTSHPLERSLSNPPMTTIDPSNLMMNTSNATSINNTTDQQQQQQQQQTHDSISPSLSSTTDVFLNCTTLTIGTWHRLKLRASDLLCTFKINNTTFEWQIEDAGCHFKMEIPLSSVANIDFVQDNNVLADVHFDISESPLFYMETTPTAAAAGDRTTTTTSWVQCSDFTEGKQASRFFRHSLKGVSQHIKQDLITLMDRCPDTRRWIRFVEPPPTTFHYSSPQQQQQQQQHHHPYPSQHHQQVPMASYQQQSQYPHYFKQQQQQQQPYYTSPGLTAQPSHTYPVATTTTAPSHHDAFMAVGDDLALHHPSDPAISSMYIPPTTSSSYWSPMYQASSSQTQPMMMGMTHPSLV